jgi:hypothetical protein
VTVSGGGESRDVDTAARTFDRERAAILSSAVGMARLKLQRGDAEGALSTLDTACDSTDELHREFLRAEGFAEDSIIRFLGEPRG